MRTARRFAQWVDALSRHTGENASYLVVQLSFFVLFEVIARYIFNHPTIWAWDTNVQLLAAITALVGCFVLLENQFVIVDIFVIRLSRKARAKLDAVTSVVGFFAMAIFLWQSADGAWTSWLKREHYTSLWEPPLYPIRFLVVIGVVLLILEMIAKFIHNLDTATSKEEKSPASSGKGE